MAGIKTALQLVPVLEQSIDLVSGRNSTSVTQASQAEALSQLQARQSLDANAAQADANEKRTAITLATQKAESDRKKSLRRAVARQRSKFGAQGLSASGGSSEAVLLGLFEESEEDRTQRAKLDNLRLGAIDQGLSNRNSLNVLQRSQLQERQKIDTLSARTRSGSAAANSAITTVGIFSDLGDIFTR